MKLTRRTFNLSALAGLFVAPAASKVVAHHEQAPSPSDIPFPVSRVLASDGNGNMEWIDPAGVEPPVPYYPFKGELAHHEHPDKVKP